MINWDRFKDQPHVFIQWKGTNACLDLYCICGSQGHLDSYFAYFYQCYNCKRKYELDVLIPMYELSEEEIHKRETEGNYTMTFNIDEDLRNKKMFEKWWKE